MADFTERFNELLNRTPVNDTALAEALGVSKQTVSAWKNGIRFPKRPTIRSIAVYFGVGVPWLQGISDDEKASIEFDLIANALGSNSPAAQKLRQIGAALSGNESELVDIYRSLNDLGQTALMGTARGLAANPDMKKDGSSNDKTTA